MAATLPESGEWQSIIALEDSRTTATESLVSSLFTMGKLDEGKRPEPVDRIPRQPHRHKPPCPNKPLAVGSKPAVGQGSVSLHGRFHLPTFPRRRHGSFLHSTFPKRRHGRFHHPTFSKKTSMNTPLIRLFRDGGMGASFIRLFRNDGMGASIIRLFQEDSMNTPLIRLFRDGGMGAPRFRLFRNDGMSAPRFRLFRDGGMGAPLIRLFREKGLRQLRRTRLDSLAAERLLAGKDSVAHVISIRLLVFLRDLRAKGPNPCEYRGGSQVPESWIKPAEKWGFSQSSRRSTRSWDLTRSQRLFKSLSSRAEAVVSLLVGPNDSAMQAFSSPPD